MPDSHCRLAAVHGASGSARPEPSRAGEYSSRGLWRSQQLICCDAWHQPLSTEFLRRGSLISGSERRLATLDSLGTASLAHLNDDQVQLVIAECAAYFQVNPYSRWFNPLDQILQGLGVSYFSNTACHLDLVQWATDPIWGKISDKSLRSELLEDGVPHLRNQLEHYDIRTILLNGGQVLRQVQDIGLVELREAGRMDLGPRTYHLVTGESNGIQWLDGRPTCKAHSESLLSSRHDSGTGSPTSGWTAHRRRLLADGLNRLLRAVPSPRH